MYAQSQTLNSEIELTDFLTFAQPLLQPVESRCGPNLKIRRQEARSAGPALCKLAPGPWRSLGGYLNYAEWEERNRFLELDAALEQQLSMEAARMGAESGEPVPPQNAAGDFLNFLSVNLVQAAPAGERQTVLATFLVATEEVGAEVEQFATVASHL